MKRNIYWLIACVIGVLVFGAAIADAQGPKGGPKKPAVNAGTSFTYQGQLKNGSALVNGSCDLAFRLYDDVAAGTQVGSAITQTLVIANGLFTTQLNTGNEFGANAFDGNARWLEIKVSNACPAAGTFTTLSPREAVSPEPYALTALYTAYKNVLVVTTSGGHYNSITAALNSISDNSATNHYLIFVAPGTYIETVTMKQFVDIEGAGELTTKITQAGSISLNTGTVVGANNAELRFLTVENTGANDYAIAIYHSSASPRLTHITATASGGTSYNFGVYNNFSSPTMTNITVTASGGISNYGVNNTTSSPTLTNVTVIASGGTNDYGVYNTTSSPTLANVTVNVSGGTISYGVYNFNSSSPTLMDVTVTASGGTSNVGIINLGTAGTVTIHRSTISGTTNSIFNNSIYAVRVGVSQLVNAIFVGTGNFTCVGAYNGNFVALNTTCQ